MVSQEAFVNIGFEGKELEGLSRRVMVIGQISHSLDKCNDIKILHLDIWLIFHIRELGVQQASDYHL